MAEGTEAGAKTVHLLRHAKSSWDDPGLSDHERPLAPRGTRAAGLLARYLAAQGTSVDLVLCSTALRARQTLELVLGSLGPNPKVRMEQGLYRADEYALWQRLAEVRDTFGSVLVVGHNPAIHGLATLLVGRGDPSTVDQMRRKFPTAALATITVPVDSWRDLEEGGGTLRSFVRPKTVPGS
jgi:phosphohistidine phosphatase